MINFPEGLLYQQDFDTSSVSSGLTTLDSVIYLAVFGIRNNPYFKESVHMYGCRAYSPYKQAAARIKEALTPAVQMAVPTHGTTAHSAHSRLLDINHPKFSGDYSQWSQFKELFTSLILDEPTITDVEKLHSLRGCLRGRPANEVSTLPLTRHCWAYHRTY